MSVIFIGEIGGNDFVDSFIEGKSIQESVTYVPYVIGETIRATRVSRFPFPPRIVESWNTRPSIPN